MERLGVGNAVGRREREKALRVLRAARGKPGFGDGRSHRGGRRGPERLEKGRRLLRVARGDGARAGRARRGRGGSHRGVERRAVHVVEETGGALGSVGPCAGERREDPEPGLARLRRPGARERTGDRGAREERVVRGAGRERVAHGAPFSRRGREARGLAEGLAGEDLARRGRVGEQGGDGRLSFRDPGGEADPRREARKPERGAVEPGGACGGRAVRARERRGGRRETAAQLREGAARLRRARPAGEPAPRGRRRARGRWSSGKFRSAHGSE